MSGPDGRHDSARHGSLTPSQGGGSGRVADPIQRDGMRAPPGTEATPTVDEDPVVDEAIVNEEVIGVNVELDAAFSPSGFTGQSSRRSSRPSSFTGKGRRALHSSRPSSFTGNRSRHSSRPSSFTGNRSWQSSRHSLVVQHSLADSSWKIGESSAPRGPPARESSLLGIRWLRG